MKKSRKFLIIIIVFCCTTGAAIYEKCTASSVLGYGIGELTDLTVEDAYPQGKLANGLIFDKLVLEKKLRLLTAFNNGNPVRRYLVALGTSPVGPKEYQGDRKTPEGKYRIDGKNPHSQYYKNLGISYPNEQDRKHAASLGKSPGGDIKIHGLPPSVSSVGAAHRLSDWTHGCIAVTDEEMEELYQRVSVGIPVEILP